MRSALIGAVVGALVAALVGSVLWVVAPRNESSGTAARPTAVLEGEPLDLQALIGKVRPSVVSIHTGLGSGPFAGEAAGSGVVLTEEGLILTNAHVIDGANSIEVAFSDGQTLGADLVGSFPQNDVALIEVRGGEGLVPAELGSSDSLQVGDDVVAIGNALNLGSEPTVTVGIVSALGRPLQAPGVQLENLIQTDAAINQGNSGGPLLNSSGQVVGINTAIIAEAQNLGFALAIDELTPLIEDIRNGNADVTANTAFLGVSTTNIDEQRIEILERFGVERDSGAFVVEVVPGSAAAAAGLEPGDVIVQVAGETVETKEDVGEIIREHEPGEQLDITYFREGELVESSAELGRRAN